MVVLAVDNEDPELFSGVQRPHAEGCYNYQNGKDRGSVGHGG
jgi:hypothetical protein